MRLKDAQLQRSHSNEEYTSSVLLWCLSSVKSYVVVMATKDSVTNTALQSSIAFLQIQKNANLKRCTSMNEDVFRIFRQTGRRIALIEKQVERERCTFLKDSYNEKNQLYKELAGIFHSKKATNSQFTNVLLASPPQGAKSRDGPVEKAKGSGHCSAQKSPKVELRSINVNVLKRCECCRRRAFRQVEDVDNDDDVFDQEAFQCESQAPDDKSNDKTKTKVARKISRASKTASDSIKGKKERSTSKQKLTKMVQFSRYDDIRIPANQRVQAGIWALKKQNVRPSDQEKQSKSVHFQTSNLPTSSVSPEVKVKSDTPGLTAVGRPTLKSRASIKIESDISKNDKVRLDSSTWASYLKNIQEKKRNNNENNTITGLSKAYCAFKKLLNKMEEENETEQIQEEQLRAESRAELPAISRPVSNASRSDSSRWVPLRRSSNTLPIRLNSWTVGNLEPASMDSFNENSKEEEALSLVRWTS